jgi:hypothetical protein
VEEEHLAALRRWGEGLRTDDRDEVRAAGRAIVLLCDDVERLERELWHLRAISTDQGEHRGEMDAGDVEGETDEAPAAADDAVTALKARFRRVRAVVKR